MRMSVVAGILLSFGLLIPAGAAELSKDVVLAKLAIAGEVGTTPQNFSPRPQFAKSCIPDNEACANRGDCCSLKCEKKTGENRGVCVK